MTDLLAFELPPGLEAREPPEARGITRDAVAMMVAFRSTGTLVHSRFALLPTFLEPGDLVVVNTSGTLPAALTGVAAGTRRPVAVHLSTRLDDGLWVVEPRHPTRHASRRWAAGAGDGEPPRHVVLGDGAAVHLLEPYRGGGRLWVARLELPEPVPAWLARHGRPIRYGHVERPWPLSDYQNV
ncbi:MAG TPA: S-adenosylmethionine:tRNA ribosyltransferase-isomerase, partial [Acidimicrobiales bacterium]|nr:S-adenosylmethionine:tRNA ribosyltransferase-isomerase [Acidimicrobiales bacterium]